MKGDAMTEEQWIDLGERATACNGWRWMPGMKILVGLNDYGDYGALRVIGANKDGAPLTRDGYGRVTVWQHNPSPDLRDPATRGCVMALVDELRLGVDTRTAADEVRAGALVAALEVAS
jgi:hypothetical protein